MPVETPEEAKNLIRGWITDRSFFDNASNIEVDPTPKGLLFQFNGKAPTTIPYIIIQPDILKRAIVVLANVTITKQRIDSLNSMKKEDRDKFLWNLQKDLIFAPPSFSFDPSFDKTGIPEGIQFTKEVSYDELTEGKLAEAVDYVCRCVLWVIWVFQKEFGSSGE
jgi:hypothetical protein